ncbi:MAG: type II toxin-antitoxin system RelE/ParE family toxin [Bdellovibrionota bacterium]
MEVVTTDEFVEWYDGLETADSEAVTEAVDFLEGQGVRLGFPKSSAIQGSRWPIRELRVQSRGKAIRVFYIFDSSRDAVLLIGGTKEGKRFYQAMIPVAEKIWKKYLKEEAKRKEK